MLPNKNITFQFTLLNSILSLCTYSNHLAKVVHNKTTGCELTVHIIPQVIVGPNLSSDHKGELLDLQQPEKMHVKVLLLSLHLDPKQVVWVQVINCSRIL
jgi:hypothetical protein